MEKRAHLLPLFFILFLVMISRPVLANGPVEPKWYEFSFVTIFIIFIIGPVIESLIVLLFLKKDEKFATYLLLFIYFLFINYFTIGPTQIFVVILADVFGTNLFVVAELFPITFEFLALTAFFGYYERKGRLKNRYSWKYQLIMTTMSNLVTIVVGILLFFIIH